MIAKSRLREVTLALIRERTIESNGCWLWQGAIGPDGYGRVGWRLPGDTRYRMRLIHRVAYQLAVGSIPSGLELDHVCRVKHCVNPEHLEAVTHRENLRRGLSQAAANMIKTACSRGHAYETLIPGRRGPVLNLVLRHDGTRTCRLCLRTSYLRHYYRHKKGSS